MQGEKFHPPKGENTLEHLVGHMQQKEEKYEELDVEYRSNFDQHLFETQAALQEFIYQQQQAQLANQVAMGIIRQRQMGQPDAGAVMPPDEEEMPMGPPGMAQPMGMDGGMPNVG